MTFPVRNIVLFAVLAGLIVLTGYERSWNVALGIVNMGLISAVMALGVNMQWGYAGLFNIGVMGFVALGGLAGAFADEASPQPKLALASLLVFILGWDSTVKAPSVAGQSSPSQPPHVAIIPPPSLLYALCRTHRATPLALGG